MAINTSALNSTLQSRVDALDAATETKEVLLLSKALEAAAGSTSVSDVLSEGVVQVNNVNSEGSAQVANVQNEGATQRASVGAVLGDYTPTTGFKTVGGQSVVGSGNIEALPAGGTVGQVVTNTASGTGGWADVGDTYMQVSYQLPNGNHGGTANLNDWYSRPLNTVNSNSISGASLASNSITLPAGTYKATAHCCFQDVGSRCRIRLYNTSNASVLAMGINNWQAVSSSGEVHHLACRFTLSSTSVLQVQYYTTTSAPTYGLGHNASLGTEVYTNVIFEKEA